MNRAGAPTPGRIAGRLAHIVTNLEAAHRRDDHKAVSCAVAELQRLRLALDAWDLAMILRRERERG